MGDISKRKLGIDTYEADCLVRPPRWRPYMTKQLIATHLGFSTGEQLLQASSIVSKDEDCTWYITDTKTWYKWVLWNTNFDVYFNHLTRQDALRTLKYLYESKHTTPVFWNDESDFRRIEAVFSGVKDNSIAQLRSDWTFE